ncbi:MAG: RNHCP domain-containing protein [Patescibacteria group bacterium]|nr:RNHCP domain-containing protein [Patescibacteria group bacterium]
MKTRKFQRTKENFTCERCGFLVQGSGYTNHCPKCLWSKHVDINPGDRQASCQGLMEPVGVKVKSGEYVIVHRCSLCGFEKRNKAAENDNFNEILKLSSHSISKNSNHFPVKDKP